MTHIFTRAALMLAAVFALTAQAAFAQSSILVVDMQKVYSDSKVGKHISSQMKALASSDEATLKSRASSLESMGKSLEAQTKGLSGDALKANTALVSQVQDFYKRQGALAQETRKKTAELQLTQAKAQSNVATQLKTILEQVAKERGASAVLEKNSVLYVPNSSSADITATVIQRLDQRMTTTSVARQSIPTR